ncbi:MAG: hypothetical protein LZ158_01540 [Thaumarchaeota archaeon]|jgi:transcription antitermination factor NusA-like protein|nr:hypothetical protein [Candidatus Terraquivivens yellowstonensis]MCL7392464.1 hypothetical protein [Candidatus Terraquivivens yellowstonensis]MCL7398442.1 hypothetical protein [Candidatus Terraquivivens yellowstonensis]MCL7399140.1 hypothetical protein [Candidatus Terraquivivens yellowstonensis]MCL7400700.1 hypothetical protein [Candidatus Terraquivivens yellowstonensis]
MEIPVCTFDLKTGIFCERCEEKIRRGEVTELDIKIMRALLELEKNFHQLQSMCYVKSVDTKDAIIVVLRNGNLSAIPQHSLASIKRKLSDILGKNVKIIEDSVDIGRFLEPLVAPARIVAINKIWLPDNSTEIRIILDDERRLKLSVESLQEISRVTKNINLKVDFARRSRKRARPVKQKAGPPEDRDKRQNVT